LAARSQLIDVEVATNSVVDVTPNPALPRLKVWFISRYRIDAQAAQHGLIGCGAIFERERFSGVTGACQWGTRTPSSPFLLWRNGFDNTVRAMLAA
jgi:hypothetical protein